MMGSKDPEKAVGRGEPKIVLNGARSGDHHRLRPSPSPAPQRLVPRFPPDPRAPDPCADGACCEGAPTEGMDYTVHVARDLSPADMEKVRASTPGPLRCEPREDAMHIEAPPLGIVGEPSLIALGQGISRLTVLLTDGRRASCDIPAHRRVRFLAHMLHVFFGGAGR